MKNWATPRGWGASEKKVNQSSAHLSSRFRSIQVLYLGLNVQSIFQTMRTMQALLALSLVGSTDGHGYVLDPPPRSALRIKGNIKGATGSCVGGICYWFSQGCTIGCNKCTGKVDFLPDTNFINHCTEQAPATIPYYARTWQNGELGGMGPPLRKKCGISPWCAPGSSPVMGPCGTACGGPGIALLRQGFPPAGFKCNDDAHM